MPKDLDYQPHSYNYFVESDKLRNVRILQPYLGRSQLAQTYPFLFGDNAHLMGTPVAAALSANSFYTENDGIHNKSMVYGHFHEYDSSWMPFGREIYRVETQLIPTGSQDSQVVWEVYDRMIKEQKNGQKFARLCYDPEIPDTPTLSVRYRRNITSLSIPKTGSNSERRKNQIVHVDKSGKIYYYDPTSGDDKKIFDNSQETRTLLPSIRNVKLDQERNILTILHSGKSSGELTEVNVPWHAE